MRGYDAMYKKLEPEKVICFGNTFPEMVGDIIKINYIESRRVVR